MMEKDHPRAGRRTPRIDLSAFNCDGLTTPIALVSEKWLRAFEFKRISPYSCSAHGGLNQREDRIPDLRYFTAALYRTAFCECTQTRGPPIFPQVVL